MSDQNRDQGVQVPEMTEGDRLAFVLAQGWLLGKFRARDESGEPKPDINLDN
ncbi:MAG: hypothetical protein ABIJ23_00660 [Candidatus Magasanikbacteria bacterium]